MLNCKLHLAVIISLATLNAFPSASSKACAESAQAKVDAVEKSAADAAAAVPAAATPKKTKLRINTRLAREVAAKYNSDNSPSIDLLNAFLESGEALSVAYAQAQGTVNEHTSKEEQEVIQFSLNFHMNEPFDFDLEPADSEEVKKAIMVRYDAYAKQASNQLKKLIEDQALVASANSNYDKITECFDLKQKMETLLSTFNAFKKGASEEAKAAVAEVLKDRTTHKELFDRFKPLK